MKLSFVQAITISCSLLSLSVSAVHPQYLSMAGEGEGNFSYMDDKLYEAARSSAEGVNMIQSVADDNLAVFLGLTPDDQSNAVHIAARWRNHKFISALLFDHIRIDPYELLCKTNSNGETPLHLAAQSGCKETVQALLDAHHHVASREHGKLDCWMERDGHGDTPLHIALRHGHDETALFMLERDWQSVSLCNNVGESLAYLAAYNFCTKFLQRILDAYCDGPSYVSFSGPFGQTAFHPCRKLSGDIMSVAIERKKNLLKVRDNKGKTVLHYAVEEERICIVERLLKADNTLAYLHDKDGLTPLHIASKRGSIRMMQIILKLSPQSMAIRDRRRGQTALHVIKMDVGSLEECLQNTRMKELINLVDNDGNTPLHLALTNSDKDTANKLLEVKGINWRLTNKQGYSPMDLCTSDDEIPLKLKRFVSASTELQKDVSMDIFFHKRVKHVSHLLDRYTWDECLTYKGPRGDSILHIAARDGNMKFINRVHECNSARLLLLSGRNSKGETPLHLAAEHGRLAVVEFILSMIPSARHTSTVNDEENPSANVAIESGNVNNVEQSSDMPSDDHENPSAIVAIESGNANNVERSIDMPGDDHENPSTIVSIENDDVNNNNQLLEDMKPWRVKSDNGDMPIHKAVRRRHSEIAFLLLRQYPELITCSNNANESVLYLAADSCCNNFIQGILIEDQDHMEYYGELVTCGRGGQNVIHAAARAGGVTLELCWKLITSQPDLLNKIDDNGKTPLHYAVENNWGNDVPLLLGEDKSAAFVYDNEGFTPLLRAATLGDGLSLGCIILSCPQSAELRHLNNNRTVLHLMKLPHIILKLYGRHQMAEKLVNETDNDGNTALHCAVLDGDVDKVCTLLKIRGIIWNIRNKQNQTPLDICIQLRKSGKTEQRLIRDALMCATKSRSLAKPRMTKLMSWVIDPARAFTEMMLTAEDLKKLLNNIAVAATLLATITFAAAFTIPGGYDQATGDAMRMKQAAIKVFMASDVLAMLMAISILVRYTFGAGTRRGDILRMLANDSIIMLQISLVATVLAFISGVYAVESHVKSVITIPVLISALLNFIFVFKRPISEVILRLLARFIELIPYI